MYHKIEKFYKVTIPPFGVPKCQPGLVGMLTYADPINDRLYIYIPNIGHIWFNKNEVIETDTPQWRIDYLIQLQKSLEQKKAQELEKKKKMWAKYGVHG